MKRLACILIAFALLSLSACSSKERERIKKNDRFCEFQDEVFDLSPDIRAVEETVDTSWIVIYVYSDHLELTEEELKETIERIAIEHDIADTDSYNIEIRDIEEAVQRYNE